MCSLPLIKIRVLKYILNNKLLLAIYLLVILFINGFFFVNFRLLIVGDSQTKEYKKAEPYYLGQDYLFQQKQFVDNETERKYNFIKSYLNSSSLLVNNEKDGESLVDFIKNQTEVEIKYFLSSDEISNSNNIIELKNENDIYKFELLERKNHQLFTEFFWQNTTDIFYTKYITNKQTYNETYYKRIYYTFFELQSLFSKYLIFMKTNAFPLKDLKISTGLNSYPPFTNFNSISGDMTIIAYLYAHLISLIFSLFSYFLNLKLVEEKEKKLSILLERNGVSKRQNFCSWFITYMLFVVLPGILSFVTLFLILPFHFILLISEILLFSLCMFLEFYFFNIIKISVKTASTLLKLLNILMPFLAIILNMFSVPRFIKIISAIIPQINVIYCTFCIFKLQTFKEISWEILWLKANKISFMESIIFYFIFISLNILFIIINHCKCSDSNKKQIDLNDLKDIDAGIQINPQNDQYINNNKYLEIKNLNISYNNEKKNNNFNLKLYPNSIFCLLGENKAGKSTLIKILSGIEKPESGNIKYECIPLSYSMSKIGFCLQEDIFFEYLTVSQHLEYFCEIKKCDKSENDDLIKKLGLEEKKDFLCSNLSGGQKRKLCVALALLGNSEIILLDEPTRGMDNDSRNQFWELIKEKKKG